MPSLLRSRTPYPVSTQIAMYTYLCASRGGPRITISTHRNLYLFPLIISCLVLSHRSSFFSLTFTLSCSCLKHRTPVHDRTSQPILFPVHPYPLIILIWLWFVVISCHRVASCAVSSCDRRLSSFSWTIGSLTCLTRRIMYLYRMSQWRAWVSPFRWEDTGLSRGQVSSRLVAGRSPAILS